VRINENVGEMGGVSFITVEGVEGDCGGRRPFGGSSRFDVTSKQNQGGNTRGHGMLVMCQIFLEAGRAMERGEGETLEP